MKNSFFIAFALLICNLSSYGYETNYALAKDRTALGAADNANAKLNISDPNIGLTVTPVYKYRINLKYTRNQLSDITTKTPWDYTLTLVLKIKDASGTLVGTTPSFTLTLNQQNFSDPTSSIYEDVILYDNQYTWLNNPKAELYVTAINSTVIGNVPNDIVLEMTQVQSVTETLDLAKDPLLSKTTDNKTLSWDYITGAQWYELEWVYIDYYDGTTSFAALSDAFVYKEPVRIATPAQFFNFHNTYSRGSIYFRVRGVTSALSYTNWYYNSASTITNAADFEPLKNLIVTTSFIENGKYKKTIEFADGSSRSRQSQTSMNSDNTVIISETKYDFEGRPVIQVMPFPYGTSTAMNYVANVNAFTVTAGASQKTAYDNQNGSAAMLTSSGASQYYSSLNPFASSINRNYIPDAQGYPYSQVVCTPDNTGRVAKSAQVGNALRIFTASPGSEQDQHFTQNFYVSPSSTELYRMFGSNVGQASHYGKIYSVDENGVVSISYTDSDGKVVATALSEKASNNLVSVTDPYNQTSLYANGLSVNRLSDQNDVDVKAHISSSIDKIANLIIGQSYTFKYDLNSSLDNQLGLCLSCEYTLELKITDPDGLSVIKDDQQNVIPYYTQDLVPTLNGCTSATYPTVSKTFTFNKIGEYTITKKLYYRTASIQALTTAMTTVTPVSVMLDNRSYTDKTAFINAFVAKKQTEANCGFTCDDNCTNYSNSFLNKINPSTSTYYTAGEIAAIKSQCITSCNADITNTMNSAPTMRCTSYKQQMLDQLRPGGFYYETAGFVDNAIANGAVFTPTPANVNDVKDPLKFDPAWAQGLLPYHKEYCIYTRMCENTTIQTALNASYMYDTYQFGSGDATSGATDWNDAATKGYLKPLAGMTIPSFTKYGYTFNFSTVPSTKLDPVFDVYGQSATALQNKLTSYYNEATAGNNIDYNGDGDKSDVLSAWEFASCYNRNNDGTFNTTQPVDYNIRRWAIFKGIYLAEKDKIVQSLLQAGCTYGYQDPLLPQTVIRMQPQNFDQATQDAWKAWANSPSQGATACSDDVLVKRAESALREIEMNCASIATISALDRAEIIYRLYKYFKDGCSTYNPQKLILSNDLTTPHLARVNAILAEPYGCSLNSIATIRTNYNDCQLVPAQSNKMMPTAEINIYVDLINDYLNLNRNSIQANPVATIGTVFSPSAITFTPLYQLPSATYNSSWFSYTMNSSFGTYPVTGVAITQNPGDKSIQMYFIGSDNTTIYSAKTGLLESIQSLNLSLSSVKMIGNLKVDDGPLNQSTNPNPFKYQIITMNDQAYDLSQGQLTHPFLGVSWLAFVITASNSDHVKNSPTFMAMADGTSKYYCPEIPNTNPFLVTFDPVVEKQKCIDEQNLIATAEATEMWDAAVNEQLQTELNTHYNGCFSLPFKENFYYETTEPKQLYYTLYYYDQAGNLIQTVPPEGVRLLGSNAFDAKGEYLGVIQPQHGLLTKYKYNVQNQMIYKITPDESGPSRDIPVYTFYNDKGQPAISQNAKQRATNTFSCITYDKLGRITKIGDIVNTTLLADLLDRTKYDQNVINYWNIDLLIADNTPTDLVGTTYDTPVGTDPSYTSRGRVTKVVRALDLAKLTASNLDSYISYQYDIHGNVKTLTNAMPLSMLLPGAELAFTIDYSYDLLSGSVKQAILDKGLPSQFIHKYCYDADNRLKSVKNSRNGLIWEEDVRYKYYLHGPLARTELGEDRVQGIDHYYTLQGWIKGINTPAVQGTLTVGANNYNRSGITDVGGDGAYGSNSYIGQDEYMMNLGYYSGDYTPISASPYSNLVSNTATTNLWTSFNSTTNGLKGLYNGNIAYWISDRSRAIGGTYTFRDNAYIYKYDQLDRIRNAYYTTALGYTTDYVWNLRDVNTPQLNDFNTSYDLNGNIKALQRYDANTNLIDDLTYNYSYQGGGQSGVLLDNKLNQITDNVAAGLVNYDIDAQASTANYTYDNIGNLIGDASEQVANITWNREGKVTSLTRAAGSAKPDFIFKYDVNGKRIYKQIIGKTGGAIDNSKTTYVYYVYDGTGNLLSTYDRVAINSMIDIRQVDASIYGSERLGVYAHTTPVLRNSFINNALRVAALNANTFQRQPGLRQYELKDHLGNVRTVITGIKAGVDVNGDNKAEFYTADVVAENDYYPFGMLMNGGYRRSSTLTYKFGYNGKPMDTEWNGEGAMYNYDFRIYDPRICKFLGVDPLANEMSAWSPYSYCFNNPIIFIDPDGQVPYPITIRSFAPFVCFGFGFHGDGRGYSNVPSYASGQGPTARAHQRILFDTDKTTISTYGWCSRTFKVASPGEWKTAKPTVSFTRDFSIITSGNTKLFTFGTHSAAANPLTPPGTPTIDVFANFSIFENKQAGTLQISGELTGDNFPSTEAFISDPSGQNVFIGIGRIDANVGKNTGPFMELPGENKSNPITSFNFIIFLDQQGNFTRIQASGIDYTIADWNKLFTDTIPQQ